MRSWRSILYLCVAASMLVYAVPRLSVGDGLTSQTIFGAAWICMALLIIAAHLHDVFGVTDKQRERLSALKRYRYWRIQQRILERSERKGMGG